MTEVEIRAVTDVNRDEVLDVLSAAYGRKFSDDWFRWKHLDCPQGRSDGLAAWDETGVVGVVFRMEWTLRCGDRDVRAMRLVDGATSPRTARRGVFSSIVRRHLDEWRAKGDDGIIIATATPDAQRSHVRNGALALPPIAMSVSPVVPRPAALVEGEAVLEDFRRPPIAGTLASTWSTGRLRWRLDPRSGQSYRCAGLQFADEPCGVVYTVRRSKGLRYLAVTSLWGQSVDQATLVAAVAWRHRALATVGARGTGTRQPARRLGWERGSSLLCVWDDRDSPVGGESAYGLRSWALDGLDLEGTI